MAQMFRYTRKLESAQTIVRQGPSSIVRFFSDDTAVVHRGDDCIKSRGCGFLGKGDAEASIFVGRPWTKIKMSSPELFKSRLTRNTIIMSTPISSFQFNTTISCRHAAPVRYYSTNSELPPHQEIGMPFLSPTMTEGNIVRWLKNEGDKVSPGEVLCEVETDNATVEMECMEEGYIAKIIKGDGAQNMKVGEIIAITVEKEQDIRKFKDYQISSSSTFPAEAQAPSETSTASPEKDPEPVKAPEPRVSQASATPHSVDRIFSSPLARKLAEYNNVPLSSLKGTGPDGHIVKADVEDYLGYIIILSGVGLEGGEGRCRLVQVAGGVEGSKDRKWQQA